MNCSGPKSFKRQSGMTLIELLMSFAILIGGLVCVFALLLAGTGAHKRAMKETEAGLIAASILADLRSEFARGDKIPAGEPNQKFITLENEYPHCRLNRAIIPLETRSGLPREYYVRVRVAWTEKGDDKYVEYNTVMFKGTPSNGIEKRVAR